ncbi:MAG: nitroreductase family protein [Planctomycetota bacterium]
MNSTISLLRNHRSVRRYSGEPVSSEHIRQAVDAGQAASTSSAIQAYCLLHVTRPSERRELAELCGSQEHIVTCGAFFIVCGDTRRHRLVVQRAGHHYDARLEAFLLAVIDATLFAQNLVLAFESMGYGICYIGGLRNNLPNIDRLLEIPDGIYPLYGLCVGTPAERPAARPRLPARGVLFEDRYPDDEYILRIVDEYDDKAPGWASRMAGKFAESRRTDVGPYYRAKGANLA